jgi:antitoxin component YwqK of YwqJK toxin-antitoxin module/Tfp pilus assembly protein PilF
MKRLIYPVLFATFFAPVLSKAQTLAPPINSGEILTKAYELYAEKKYEEAAAEYAKIDENDTNYLAARVELANSYLLAKKDSLAILVADEMLREKNQYEQSFYIVKGSALDNMGKLEESIKVYNEGLAKHPKSYTIYYNIGLDYQRIKDYKNAEKNYLKAIAINPYHPSSHLQLGVTSFHQGKLAPAVLSWMFFLQLENSTSRSSDVVVYLEKVLKGEAEPNGPLVVGGETDDFSELESIIKSKVALNGKYKSKIDLQFDLVKQLQLFFEKLEYNASDKGVWMQTYVPFFTSLQKEGYFEDMMYFSLTSIQNENVDKWLKKHASQQQKYVSWVVDKINNTLQYFEEDMNGTMQKVHHYYYSNYKIEAYGNVENNKKVGYWKYFYKNGNLEVEGKYNDKGEKDGLWKYYYESGELREEANYKDGKLNGAYTKYETNGSKAITANYVNDLYEGKVETWYVTNTLNNSFTFKAGKKVNSETGYYATGEKKYEIGIVNEKAEGTYVRYYQNGQVAEKTPYVADKRNGPYTLYYEDGTKKEEGTYKEDILVGGLKSYHPNGKLKSEGSYNDKGSYAGLWKKYLMNGVIEEEWQYSERGKIISHKYYTPSGLLENELIFKNEELSQAKSYDDKGNVLNDQKRKGDPFKVSFYHSTGNKMSEGNYVDGVREGEWKFYHANGYLSATENYKKGKLEGKKLSYFANGKVKYEINYKDNTEDGLYRNFYENGNVEREGYYANGTEQGYWHYYFKNGTHDEIRYYLNGETTGKQLSFSRDGKKNKEDRMENGYLARLTYFDSTGKIQNTMKFPFGTGSITYMHANGKPRLTGQYKAGSAEGPFTWFYANGQVETKYNYKNDRKEGQIVSYYEDGTKTVEENYKAGELHGPYRSYYENGNMNEDRNYDYGELNGTHKTYYENKSVYKVTQYVFGKAEGTYYYYSEDGSLIMSRYYHDDRLVSYSYLKNGKYDSIPVKNETGKIVAYYANGQKSIEFELQSGIIIGKRIAYFPNGKLRYEENYLGGSQDGMQKNYYSNGNLKSEENYVIDEKNGAVKYYYENGKLKESGKYLNGAKFGDWKYYDATGKLTKTVRYYNDQMML